MIRGMISYFIKLPLLCLFYIAMMMCIIPELHGTFVVLGIPWDFAQGGIDMIVFGRWMLIVGISVLVNGIILEKGRKIEIFIRIRNKKQQDFYRGMIGTCVILNVVWGMILSIGTAFYLGISTALIMFPLLTSNLLFWSMLQVFLDFYLHRNFINGITIIFFNGGSCLFGIYHREISCYLPSFWGMLCRSAFGTDQLQMKNSYLKMIMLNIIIGMIIFQKENIIKYIVLVGQLFRKTREEWRNENHPY